MTKQLTAIEQKRLDDMARDYVGDDKSRLWFVSDGSSVVMVTTDEESARSLWLKLARRYPLQESTLENRTGIVSSVEPISDEPNAPLQVHW